MRRSVNAIASNSFAILLVVSGAGERSQADSTMLHTSRAQLVGEVKFFTGHNLCASLYISPMEFGFEIVTNRCFVSTVPSSGLPWDTAAVHYSLQSLPADGILLFSNS